MGFERIGHQAAGFDVPLVCGDVRRQLLSWTPMGDLSLRLCNMLRSLSFVIPDSGQESFVNLVHVVGLDAVDGKNE